MCHIPHSRLVPSLHFPRVWVRARPPPSRSPCPAGAGEGRLRGCAVPGEAGGRREAPGSRPVLHCPVRLHLPDTNSKINHYGKTATAETGSAGVAPLLGAGPCVTALVARPRGQPCPGSSLDWSSSFPSKHGSACSMPRLSFFLLSPPPHPTTTKLVEISASGSRGNRDALPSV